VYLISFPRSFVQRHTSPVFPQRQIDPYGCQRHAQWEIMSAGEPVSDETASMTAHNRVSRVDASSPAQLNKPSQSSLPLEPHTVLFFLIGFRLLNALTVHTFFQPDEYFQALEPAWQWAFGPNAGAWITWVRSINLHTGDSPKSKQGSFEDAYRNGSTIYGRLYIPLSSGCAINWRTRLRGC
jgi:hypothetical protein